MVGQLQLRIRRVIDRLTEAGHCVPLLTLFILIVVEIWLRQANPVDAMGYLSVDQWNLPPRINICRQANPDVALVGSSLLMALALEPHEFINFCRIFPPYFQAQLRRATDEDVTCLNMCTAGQVMSESYLVTRVVLSQKDCPPVIIFGISLRDFLDNKARHEWGTDSFASLSPYVPIAPDVLSALSGDMARREFLLDHFSYLYRNHHDFKNVLTALTENMLDTLPLDQPFPRTSYLRALGPSRDGWLPEEWVPRRHMRVNVRLATAYIRDLHIVAYRRGAGQSRAIQTHYLESLVSACNHRGVKLVLLNMPLSDQIIALAPPRLHKDFGDFLEQEARTYHLPLLNFFQDQEFKSSDFADGAHLRYGAACKLADRIIEELKKSYPDLLKAIADHARMRNRDPAVKSRQERPFALDAPVF